MSFSAVGINIANRKTLFKGKCIAVLVLIVFLSPLTHAVLKHVSCVCVSVWNEMNSHILNRIKSQIRTKYNVR